MKVIIVIIMGLLLCGCKENRKNIGGCKKYRKIIDCYHDSRVGDSLTLIHFKKVNPRSKITWDLDKPLEMWDNIDLSGGRVTTLFFSSLDIDSIPPQIINLKQINRCFLSFNKIRSLPSGIFGLENLKELAIANNRITEIPEGIKNCSSLKILQLSNNDLTTIPQSIFSLPLIECIYLGGNKLSQLNISNFSTDNKIWSLDVSHNVLSEVRIRGLNNLIILKINSNLLTCNGVVLKDLPRLKVFGFEGNSCDSLTLDSNLFPLLIRN